MSDFDETEDELHMARASKVYAEFGAYLDAALAEIRASGGEAPFEGRNAGLIRLIGTDDGFCAVRGALLCAWYAGRASIGSRQSGTVVPMHRPED